MMPDSHPRLEHGRLYTLRLGDGTGVPLVAWRTDSRFPWQFIDTCLGGDLCVHARHPHLIARTDGSFDVDVGTQPGPYDLDVRAVTEGLTVHDLKLANRMALELFRATGATQYPCGRCGAQFGVRHDEKCFADNLVPLFPMFDGVSWRDANDIAELR